MLYPTFAGRVCRPGRRTAPLSAILLLLLLLLDTGAVIIPILVSAVGYTIAARGATAAAASAQATESATRAAARTKTTAITLCRHAQPPILSL